MAKKNKKPTPNKSIQTTWCYDRKGNIKFIAPPVYFNDFNDVLPFSETKG